MVWVMPLDLVLEKIMCNYDEYDVRLARLGGVVVVGVASSRLRGPIYPVYDI